MVFLSFKRNIMYIQRVNQESIIYSFERSFISTLLGPRRVGKSTLVGEYVKKYPERKWVLFNMDSQAERLRIEEGYLKRMIEEQALMRIGEIKLWVVIDEAQKCPALFDQIKALYDKHKDQNILKFILTGSAHLNLHHLAAESLAGRVQLLQLREFTLREMAQYVHPGIVIPRETAFNIICVDDVAIVDKLLAT